MNFFKFRKFIFTNLFIFNLINFLYPSLSFSAYRKSIDVDGPKYTKLANYSDLEEAPNYIKINNPLESSIEIASDVNFNPKFKLEIQSDKQYQQDSVLYAEGNVLANYKGNTLKADVLVYDKSKGVVEAKGNIILILGDQIFSADKINFDFKNNQGSFIKVKGLIKTKSLIKNLDFL